MPHIQPSRSYWFYLLCILWIHLSSPSQWPYSEPDHHHLSSWLLQHSPHRSHWSVLLPFFTPQLNWSRRFPGYDLSTCLHYPLAKVQTFAMTYKTLCDGDSAHLSSLIFSSPPCSVPKHWCSIETELLMVPQMRYALSYPGPVSTSYPLSWKTAFQAPPLSISVSLSPKSLPWSRKFLLGVLPICPPLYLPYHHISYIVLWLSVYQYLPLH